MQHQHTASTESWLTCPDDAERWKRITDPRLNERTGRHEWPENAAKRVVGQKDNHPRTVSERVTAIHDLAAMSRSPWSRHRPAAPPGRWVQGDGRRDRPPHGQPCPARSVPPSG
ncbi:DUF6192 family protein [Actinoallomurus acaciae]|uniref:DUF6192 family protein n=1 Tax=Actinoallomurus acaciae TaxID=502577 RepID=A0ABV5YA81_9ACTN